MNKPLTFGSLFAGIGGFDLGFERAGMRCEWQVEIDPYCQRVLAKHWPNVRRWDDVRTFPPSHPTDWSVDVICGGFPCQDISSAGKHAGINGERSGLWFEYQRIIRHLRPRAVVVENVADLLIRGFDRVLGGLAACGYDAEWQCLPAGAFGAVHSRDRVFVLAFDSNRDHDSSFGASKRQRTKAAANGSVQGEDSKRLPWRDSTGPNWRGYWANEPAVGRVADGVPCRVDRLHGLGNAVVPQVAEWIGRRIVKATTED
jgi:DNA (cytosine-5)-methyltransferase 1